MLFHVVSTEHCFAKAKAEPKARGQGDLPLMISNYLIFLVVLQCFSTVFQHVVITFCFLEPSLNIFKHFFLKHMPFCFDFLCDVHV